MFKKCLENRIIRRNEDDYKCYLCHHTMKQSCFNVVKEHLLSDKHKKKLNQIDQEQRKKELEQLLELTGPERKKIVENRITFDRSIYLLNCHVCDCKINGLSNTLGHIDGISHKRNLRNLIEQNNKAVDEEAKRVSCDKINTNKTAVKEIANIEASIPIMQLKSNGITYNEHNNSHYCNICKMRIIATPNISQHIQGLLHKALESKLKALTPHSKSDCIIYDEKCNSYHCTICNYKIDSTPNVTQHIQGFMHQTMLKTENAMKTTLVKNASQGFLNQTTLKFHEAKQANKIDNINQEKGHSKDMNYRSHFSEIYNCKTCQAFIGKNTIRKCHIILHLYQEFDSLRNFDLIKFELKSNKKLYLKCLLCNSFVCESYIKDADQALEKHLETDLHHDRLALFNYNKNIINNSLRIPTMNDQLNDINLEKSMYQPKKNIFVEYFCNLCNVKVPIKNEENHATGKSHIKKVPKEATSNVNAVKKTEFNSQKNSDYYICFICDKPFSESSNLLEHFKTPEHQLKIICLNMINKSSYIKLLQTIVHKEKREVIQCLTCNATMYSFITAFEHMIGKNHKEKLKLPSSNSKNLNTELLAQVTNEFEKMSATLKNLQSKFPIHENTTKNQNLPVIKTKSVKKIKEAGKFEASIEELNQLGFSTENIQPLSILNPNMADKLLGDLLSPDFSISQTKRLPTNAKSKSSRTPKVEDGRNSFVTNVLLHGKTFIEFCIDPGQDNIFNFDNEKISLMKLGVSLTFPYNSDRVCIPCGEQFTNSVQSLFEHLQSQDHLKNICNSQVDDNVFEKFPEQFSDLRLAKLYMRVSDQSIQCHVCDIEIEDDDNIIRQHAQMSVHEEKSKLWKEESEQLFKQYLTIYKDIWYYAEVFFCEICKKRYEFEIEFAIHLIHPEHMKKVYQLKHKGTILKFDLCPPCATYWFGKADCYEVHCTDGYHKLLVNKKDFIVPNLPIVACEYLDNIDKNIDLLVSESDKVDLEKNKVIILLEAIVEAVKPKYPNAEAYVFGSRLSHLGFSDSDVDVFLDCENVYYTSSTKTQSQQYTKFVKTYFDNRPDAWKVDEVLIPTRVPILKLRHIPTNLKCDISFVNGLSVEKSKLVGMYSRAFPICRKLILCIKRWSTHCRISGSDCLTTFAISWCVIFYLQLQGMLPSVYELIKYKIESKIVDGWECGFEEKITVGKSNLSFKEYLKGFFTYFAKFDYQKSVVCPYMGKTIDKHTFAYTDELPPEMDIYKRRLKSNEVEIFRFDSPMCIQDPIDLSQNLTKAVSKKHLRCFKQYCIFSADKC